MLVDRRIDSERTVSTLETLVARHGAPELIRCDNGPELTAHAVRDWCRFSDPGSAFIDPGAPWQNPYVESFHARVRDELLDVEQFSCLAEAQVVIEDCRQDYNTYRPHSSLGNLTPRQFAATCRAPQPPAAGKQGWGRAEGKPSTTTISVSLAAAATPTWSTAESG